MYSFGVLLCEMCIGEQPDPERRNDQVRRVRSRSLRNLVHDCLRDDPDKRPDMARITQDIESRFKGSNSCESRVSSNSRGTVALVGDTRRISVAPARAGRRI